MGTVFTEGRRLGDWNKGETERPKDHARDAITVLAGETLVTGTVLGKITASGKYVGIDFAASDGSQTAAGILVTDSIVGDTTADAKGVAIVRGHCDVNPNFLTWPVGATTNQKNTALATLKTLAIIARTGA